jgi:hypothetical protein
VTGQICKSHNEIFYNGLGTGREGPKYMIFYKKSTTERLLLLQKRPCLGAEHGGHGIFDLPRWLGHQTGLDDMLK